MPFYSIIIPTFNSERTIKECLSSITSQTFEDFEIIIQDGLSVDNTIEAIHSCNDLRIKLFCEKDLGVYDAMNKSIEKASGEWFLFLGSDDLLADNHVLEKASKYLDKDELVYGNVKIVGNNLWAKDGEIYKGEISQALLFKHNYCHQSIFYNKRIFEEGNRYNLKYPVCADYDFNLFCTSQYNVKHIPLIVSLFYTGGLSSVITDYNFERDKWVNIVSYFKNRLIDKNLIEYKSVFKSTWKTFFKRAQFGMALLSLRIYIFYKMS